MPVPGIRRVASVVVSTACALVPAACLPSLDHDLLLPNCAGGIANGELEDGEECDDGNPDDDDGCSARCRMECPAPGAIWRRADGGNDHCYTPLDAVVSLSDARDRCSVAFASLVTLRSEPERSFVAGVLAHAPNASSYYTAYLLDTATVTVGCKTSPCTLEEAIADPPNNLREPGILSGYPAVPGNNCPGCYADGLGPGFFTTPNDRLVLDPRGELGVAAAGSAVDGAVCERPPAGTPGACNGPSCAVGANTERRWNGYRYAYYSELQTADAAELTCQNLGGHLYYVESENEREAVFRFFRNELTGTAAWLGLRSDASGAWTWADGVADGTTRPAPWLLAPGTCASCCAVQVLGPGTGPFTYGEGLARKTACVGANGAAPPTNPFLCKIPQ